MDKDFFVKEIEAHSGMLYRVAYMVQMPDTLSATADEINPGYQRLILTK